MITITPETLPGYRVVCFIHKNGKRLAGFITESSFWLNNKLYKNTWVTPAFENTADQPIQDFTHWRPLTTNELDILNRANGQPLNDIVETEISYK